LRDYKLFIQDIILSCQKISRFIENVNFNDFSKDDKTIDAVIRNLEIIGEAVRKIPDLIKEKNANIDWQAIIGMRNIVIHDYFGVDIEEVWKTIREDIPALEKAIKSISE
jgi:uncharacterized protein with HEPN domain